VELYGQEAEADLLARLLPHLRRTTVIDVGAERGAFSDSMLRAGSEEVHAIEPAPSNATALRERFAGEERVIVHECALGAIEGQGILQLAADAGGTEISYGHTLLETADTEEIAWPESVEVPVRTLDNLVAARELPSLVGVLKIDTEGSDLAVVQGMGSLDCDVVMVEHWVDLPHSLGSCPWRWDEMADPLAERGFGHFALFAHYGAFTVVQWDDARIPSGRMGNLVFLHDRVVAAAMPEILYHASASARTAADWAEAQADAAAERLTTIAAVSHERELQTETAAERLRALERLTLERNGIVKSAEDRLEALTQATAQLKELARERDLQAQAASERLAALEALERDRDLQRKAAEERLQVIEDLAREKERQAVAAEQRLGALETLDRDRNRRTEGTGGWR